MCINLWQEKGTDWAKAQVSPTYCLSLNIFAWNPDLGWFFQVSSYSVPLLDPSALRSEKSFCPRAATFEISFINKTSFVRHYIKWQLVVWRIYCIKCATKKPGFMVYFGWRRQSTSRYSKMAKDHSSYILTPSFFRVFISVRVTQCLSRFTIAINRRRGANRN